MTVLNKQKRSNLKANKLTKQNKDKNYIINKIRKILTRNKG